MSSAISLLRAAALCLLMLPTCRAAAQESAQAPLPKKQPADLLDGPPIVSAKAWAILDVKADKLIDNFRGNDARQMASTTKIMTAFLVLQLAEKNPKVLEEIVVVSERADKTSGSSARIRAGERYVVRDLLYGLLLPSGNDAAVALAEHFGKHFRDADTESTPLQAFVAQMNRQAKTLGMSKTKYLDPHGNSRNLSSARDLTVLASHAMRNKRFRDYVQTRRHQCKPTDAKGEARTATWSNTNRLLSIEGFDGIKTGTTGGAGACLVSSGHRGKDHLIVVVLGCTSSDGRYVDTRNLYRRAWRERARKVEK